MTCSDSNVKECYTYPLDQIEQKAPTSKLQRLFHPDHPHKLWHLESIKNLILLNTRFNFIQHNIVKQYYKSTKPKNGMNNNDLVNNSQFVTKCFVCGGGCSGDSSRGSGCQGHDDMLYFWERRSVPTSQDVGWAPQ